MLTATLTVAQGHGMFSDPSLLTACLSAAGIMLSIYCQGGAVRNTHYAKQVYQSHHPLPPASLCSQAFRNKNDTPHMKLWSVQGEAIKCARLHRHQWKRRAGEAAGRLVHPIQVQPDPVTALYAQWFITRMSHPGAGTPLPMPFHCCAG